MKKILKSPVVIIISLILGCIIGIYFKKIVPYLKDINSVYISLLSMSATPLVICSIIINIEKVFKNKKILKMLGLFSALLMLLVGIFSFCSIYFFKDVLKPDENSMLVINKMISTNIVDQFENIAFYDDNSYIINKNQSNALKSFLFNIVPDNVFTALAENRMLQIIVFCMIFGGMLSFIKKEKRDNIKIVLEGIYMTLYKFICYVMLFMPFSLLTMIAKIVSDGSAIKIFATLPGLILVAISCMLITILISFIIVSICTRIGIKAQFKIMKQTIFTALATGSGMTTAMSCLEEAPKLGIDKNIIESIIPVTTFLCSIGVLIQTVIVSVYAIIIYNVSISFNLVIVVILGAILFSISTVSTSSQTAASMLGIVMDAFNLPLDVVGVIYILVGTFCSRFKTFCKLYPNLAVVAVLDRIYKSKL